jgi:methylthioribose-1-phosphate isomerase
VSTIDFTLASGEEIPIEERHPSEVTHPGGRRLTPVGVAALNPAFDVTPSKYVTAIVTEKGIIRRPYRRGIARIRPRR